MPGSRTLGLIAACATVVIWAGFILIIRFAVETSYTVEELMLLRLLPGTLIMLPWILKLGVWPSGLTWPRRLLLMFGASSLFPYVVSEGLTFAPASDGGALAPGMLPFWTALAAWALMGEVPGPYRRFGLALILLGAIIVSLWQVVAGADEGAWRGHVLFLIGSGAWGVYTVVFRQSGLTPLHALVIGLFWGTLFGTPLLIMTGELGFVGISWEEILIMAALQGLFVGIIAMFLYGYAVEKLGAAQAGAFGALTPILALVGGGLLLGEEITWLKAFGVCLVAAGVFLASGVLSRNRD
ncbi:MAG: DMT family transporter [Pseudomonadota bacterium]